MNRHTLTAPVPQRQLGCLITLCLLAAAVMLLSFYSKLHSTGKRIGELQKSYPETLVLTPPGVSDVFSLSVESPIGRSIVRYLIAFHFVELRSTFTGDTYAAVKVDRPAVPIVLIDVRRARTALTGLVRHKLVYDVSSTVVYILFVPFGTMKEDKRDQNEQPGSDQQLLTVQGEPERVYNRHEGGFIVGQTIRAIRCTGQHFHHPLTV